VAVSRTKDERLDCGAMGGIHGGENRIRVSSPHLIGFSSLSSVCLRNLLEIKWFATLLRL
jgi:hypothetical protein